MADEPLKNAPGSNEPPALELLELLATDWQRAKLNEKKATANRVRIEEQMLEFPELKRHAEKNGSVTTTAGAAKITTKDGETVKCSDFGQLWQLCHDAGIVNDDMPVKVSKSVDAKVLDKLKESHPELYLQLSEIITRAPSKVGITVKVEE